MKQNPTGKKPFSRSRLVKELSWSCELPQTTVKTLLEKLIEVARREASNTFVLPGICKLEVVRRKPRKVRNPRTGETFMLPERDALRITAPRSLKLACAKVIEPTPEPAEPAAAESPAVAAIAAAAEPIAAPEAPAAAPETPAAGEPAATPEEVAAPEASEPAATAAEVAMPDAAEPTATQEESPSEETAAPEEAAAAEESEPAAEPEPAPAVDPNMLISFRCPRCKQEVEATGDMVGLETECPTCGNLIVVPAESEPGTIHGAAVEGEDDGLVRHAQTVSSQEAESLSPEKLKGLTIRIDVGELGLDSPQKAEAEPQPEQMVSFVCMTCKQEIEASRDMAGETTACPNCGAPLIVPSESTANTLHGVSHSTDEKTIKAMKGRTMRIDLGEDF